MGLTNLAVRRPLFITMAFLAVVVFGLVSYQRLGVNLLPKVDFPLVTVVTAYPGASADSVEKLVTIPMEDSLSGLNDLDYVTSTSVEGVSTVVLVFTERANSDTSAIDVERKVNGIRLLLPTEITPPTIIKADLNALPVMNLSLSGQGTPAELTLLAEDKIVPRLKTVPGVSSVDVVGGRAREIQIKVNPERLRAYGLSILQVNSIIGSRERERSQRPADRCGHRILHPPERPGEGAAKPGQRHRVLRRHWHSLPEGRGGRAGYHGKADPDQPLQRRGQHRPSRLQTGQRQCHSRGRRDEEGGRPPPRRACRRGRGWK